MSDTQKSPVMGLSEESPTGPTDARGMEINAVPISAAADLTKSPEKDGKFHPGMYPFVHPAGLIPRGTSMPLINQQDVMSHHALLAQMQMLSFYQFYGQQKKFVAEAENRERMKLWEQDRMKEMQEKQMEAQKLNFLKQKPKEKESAIASSEVKQHLRTALLNKRRQGQSQTDIHESVNRAWKRSQSSQSPPSSAQASMSPPYRVGGPLRRTADVEFPIRKTLSEPNLKVKSIKHKLAQERRNSPHLVRRRHPDQYNSPLSVDTTNQNGVDPPGSGSPVNLGSTSAIGKDKAPKRSFEEALLAHSQPVPENLYISMPNISLNKAHNHNSPLTEADIRARHASKYGVPLTAQMMHPGFQRPITGISEEELYMHGMSGLSVRRLAHPYLSKPNIPLNGDPPTAHQPAHQRHMRHTKPLSRTQSAPLPIMHPAAASMLLAPQQTILENQELVKQYQDQLAKEQQKKSVIGQLRQTLLQRSSTSIKAQMEHVDEESEARLIQEMQESREDHFDSQQKHLHSSHGSLYAASQAAGKPEETSRQGGWTRCAGPRYLSRTHSSPLVAFATPSNQDIVEAPMNLAQKNNKPDATATGLVYDEAMLRHHCPCGDNRLHIENPSRIQSIWMRLQSCGIAERCKKIDGKKATIEQLQLCHSESYSLFFGVNEYRRKNLGLTLPGVEFQRLPCGGVGVDSDTVWNEEHSPHAARIAVGSVIDLASRVYEKQLKNGLALVRPPGHHSEEGQAMGFCFFNSVAIAAKHLKHKLGANKILILDWDVHHGNGTQQMTYDDPCILYVSLHRHDNGMFFPGTGSVTDCGEKQGLGFNVNIAFSGGLDPPMGDAEYMAAFRSIVMPIIEDFKPQITLVSAGFDGADGHAAPLGGYKLSSACFGFMTKQLMTVCDGKVVLVLEGGYNVPTICDASEMCCRALLGENVPLPNQEEIMRKPCPSAVQSLQEAAKIQAQFWPKVANHVPKIGVSFVDSLRVPEKDETETVSAMASLSMVNASRQLVAASSTDSEPMEES